MVTERVFVGRSEELDALAAALADAPGVVVVEGEPGIGKTTLVERFTDALDGVTVLRGSAVETEADLPFGVVDHLLRHAGGAGVAGGAHRLAIGTRVLETISEAAPAVVVVDDVQWADAASIGALVFAVRRLVAERVLVVLTARSDQLPEAITSLPGVRLRLSPLGECEFVALSEALGAGLTSRGARRLRAQTGGSPLYARALLEEVPAERWNAADRDLPAPRAYSAIIARRLAECGQDARALVEAVTVLGPCPLTRAAEVAAGAESAGRDDGVPRGAAGAWGEALAEWRGGDPFEALDEAVERGLLVVADDERGGIRMAHPLVGAAVLAVMPVGRRARLHRVAATLAEDEAVALRHRAEAAAGPDAALAGEFAAFAHRAGGRPAAAAALLAASRLSPDPAQRDERLLQAVNWLLLAGDLAQARAFAARVEAMPPSAARDNTLAGFALTTADTEAAAPFLASAWAGCTTHNELAALVAHRTGFHALMDLRDEDVVEWAARAAALAPDRRLGSEWIALRALGLWRLGRKAEAYAALAPADARDAHPAVLGMRGWLRCADDDLTRGRPDLARSVADGLAMGAAANAANHLTTLARAHYAAGDWQDATVAAERAVALSTELEHAPGRAFVWWGAVAVPAARGDWAIADEYARRAAAEHGSAPDRRVAVGMAMALPAAARGDAAAVLAALAPVAALSTVGRGEGGRGEIVDPGGVGGRGGEPGGVDAPGFWPWAHLYAEALAGVGRVDDADAFLAPHERLARDAGHRSSIALLARARGRVEVARGDASKAREALEQALDVIAPLQQPYEHGQIALAYGRLLRRAGQRRAAAVELTHAIETFKHLQARPALQQAETELEACGRKPGRRGAAERPGLTPQEEAVARLVATGRSNRDVAQELLVSVKTVEVHLTRIYAKLGVSSRAQLAALTPSPRSAPNS